jgi:hypothetical protein
VAPKHRGPAFTRHLDDKDVLRISWWRENVHRVIQLFLEHLVEAIDDSRIKFHTGGDAGSKRDSFDRLTIAA